jgi:cell division protein ZapA
MAVAMTAKPKTLDVSIMGRAYKVVCADDEREALTSAVEYLDRKMNEIKSAGKVASAERIAVMAALNITHELLNAKNNHTGFDSESWKRRMAVMEATLSEALSQQDKLP